MNITKKDLIDSKNKYEEILYRIKKIKIEKIPGCLIVQGEKHQQYYYSYTDKRTNKRVRKYIKFSEIEFAKKLAFSSYITKLQNLVIMRIRQFNQIIETFEDDEIDRQYSDLSKGRRDLFPPIEPTKDQIFNIWKSSEYKGKEFDVNSPVIITNKGERVRSKSEKLIADILYSYGIEYKYEAPLILPDGRKIYPDFTIFVKKKNKIIYWEHHGLMDNIEYLESTINKIQLYEKNGIYRGDNLIITYETKKLTLNNFWIELLINKYLI